jgi:hypothetical protein
MKHNTITLFVEDNLAQQNRLPIAGPPPPISKRETDETRRMYSPVYIGVGDQLAAVTCKTHKHMRFRGVGYMKKCCISAHARMSVHGERLWWPDGEHGNMSEKGCEKLFSICHNSME